MRTIKSKLKLSQFSKNELDQRKLNALQGGCECLSICVVVCGDLSGSISIGAYRYGAQPGQYEY